MMATCKRTEKIPGDVESFGSFMVEYTAKTHEAIQSMGTKLESKIDTLVKELCDEIQGLRGDIEQMKARSEFLEHKVGKQDILFKTEANERILLEIHAKKFQLRFRAIPEQPGEDIRARMIKALTALIDCDEKSLDWDIDKVYRLNSRFAAMRKLPRDVLVHFVRKTTRDRVLNCHFKAKLRMENVDIIVLKEKASGFGTSLKRQEFLPLPPASRKSRFDSLHLLSNGLKPFPWA